MAWEGKAISFLEWTVLGFTEGPGLRKQMLSCTASVILWPATSVSLIFPSPSVVEF